MEPLVEVATEGEMHSALDAGARVLGINNRNLHTFELDLSTTDRLCAVAEARTDIRSPAGVAILALSGVRDGHDVARFWRAGAKGILVGETLMRAADPAAKARVRARGWLCRLGLGMPPPVAHLTPQELLALLGDAAASTAVRADVPPPPLVKICGVRDAETAVAAARSGADLIGLICVPASKRFVPVDDAAAIVAAVRRFRYAVAVPARTVE